MSRKLSMANTRMKLLAGAVVLGMAAMASAASAQTLVGGGATLPAVGYIGSQAQSANPATQKQFTPAAGSLFAAFTSTAVSYCQTGSGAGKNILAGVSGNNVQNDCPGSNVIATPTGFGAASTTFANRPDLTQPNFAASDSPFATADITNYHTGHGNANFPVQFPAVAGAVAIAFHKTGVTSLALSDAQVCGIFAGTITNWSDLVPGATGTIHVAYRSDGSGTSFSISNHLAAVCQGLGVGSAAGAHFNTNQTFATAVAPFGLPNANWTGVSGNPAVANAIVADASGEGTIGYVEAANTPFARGITAATVGGISPTSFGAGGVTLPVSVTFNAVIADAVDSSTGRPVLAPLASAPDTKCVAVVDPSQYATPAAGTYPILAVSYLLGNVHGNNGDLAHTQAFLGLPYNTAIRSNVTTIGSTNGNGLGYLAVTDAATGNAVTASDVASCLVD